MFFFFELEKKKKHIGVVPQNVSSWEERIKNHQLATLFVFLEPSKNFR
jgi:hypothetical protein